MKKRVMTGEKKLPTGNLAKSIDWVKAGHVGPARTQGSCGSCWAFTTTAALESYYSIANPKERMP
jgi:C1A family cysteine protease